MPCHMYLQCPGSGCGFSEDAVLRVSLSPDLKAVSQVLSSACPSAVSASRDGLGESNIIGNNINTLADIASH